jgi:hypothetical protein
MGKLPPHFDDDIDFFTGLLSWTDGVSLTLAVLVILLLIAWWPA